MRVSKFPIWAQDYTIHRTVKRPLFPRPTLRNIHLDLSPEPLPLPFVVHLHLTVCSPKDQGCVVENV